MVTPIIPRDKLIFSGLYIKKVKKFKDFLNQDWVWRNLSPEGCLFRGKCGFCRVRPHLEHGVQGGAVAVLQHGHVDLGQKHQLLPKKINPHTFAAICLELGENSHIWKLQHCSLLCFNPAFLKIFQLFHLFLHFSKIRTIPKVGINPTRIAKRKILTSPFGKHLPKGWGRIWGAPKAPPEHVQDSSGRRRGCACPPRAP